LRSMVGGRVSGLENVIGREEPSVANTEIDEKFVAEQKERLLQIRDELQRIQSGMQGDEQNRSEEEGDLSQHDSGDMSQQMFTREMDATIGEQAGRRLEEVERALAKIEEGTYGLSDESGDPIPRGRLEAAPEAIRTVDEQQELERERRPPV
jgi:DnaK suppressor protein